MFTILQIKHASHFVCTFLTRYWAFYSEDWALFEVRDCCPSINQLLIATLHTLHFSLNKYDAACPLFTHDTLIFLLNETHMYFFFIGIKIKNPATNIPQGFPLRLAWFVAAHGVVPFTAMLRNSVLMPITVICIDKCSFYTRKCISTLQSRFNYVTSINKLTMRFYNI